MSTARLIFAGTLLCMSGVGFAQSPTATPSTGGRIFQDPSAATAGEAKSGATATTPGTDTSGNKSFFESRSNTARTPGEAKAVAPAADASTKKTFNESRSNALRTTGDPKTVTPGTDPSAKKTFNESRSNALRTPGDAKVVVPGADPSGNKSYYESRSNTANRKTGDAKATVAETSAATNSLPAPSAPK